MEENNYEKEFISALKEKIRTPSCRFCGCNDYLALNVRAAITMDEYNAEGKRKIVPSGIIICKKCGHIEMFALGVLKTELLSKQNEEINNSEGENSRE